MSSATTRRGVLVTGSSRGIGRAIALAFAQAGDRVTINYRGNREAAEELAAQLPGEGHLVVGADLADPAAVQRMVEEVAEAFGGIDVLVNNAGVANHHPILETSYEEWQSAWRSILDLNVAGYTNTTWCAVRHMGPGSRIINVTSRAAFRPLADQPAYSASKAAMNSFTQAMAAALGSRGISVTAVAPGPVATDMGTAFLETPAGKAVLAMSPFNRIAEPEEIAAAVSYLASPEAEWASGTVIDLNGAASFRL